MPIQMKSIEMGECHSPIFYGFKKLQKMENTGFGGCWKLKQEENN